MNCVLCFGTPFDATKTRKRNFLPLIFFDLELKAIQLLRTYPSVAAAYHSTFRHVLVDEAQDLNPTQDEFLRLLTGVSAGNLAANAPERFFVGDVKQSIFRFRQSDVRILNNLKGRDWP